MWGDARAIRGYLFERLLPLWRDNGIDPHGTFLYRLGHDAVPLGEPERRLRVQARQTWVFARAAAHGIDWARPVAQRGFDQLLARFADAAQGGFWLMLDASGAPLERSKELYEHAFVMLAAAAVHGALGDPRARDVADQVWQLAIEKLADPERGGFYDGGDEAWRARHAPRRQNPHMHLFEALLAWAAVDPRGPWLERAQPIVDLFHARFYDREAHILVEHFTEDWQRVAAPDGDVVEPGHHFEWCFLLTEHARLRHGARRWDEACQGLFDWASRHGIDPAGGVHDELDRAGAIVRASKRVWPQTEYIRALAVRYQILQDPQDHVRLREMLGFLADRYHAGDHGGCREQLDPGGTIVSDAMLGTTVYHLCGAYTAAAEALE